MHDWDNAEWLGSLMLFVGYFYRTFKPYFILRLESTNIVEHRITREASMMQVLIFFMLIAWVVHQECTYE